MTSLLFHEKGEDESYEMSRLIFCKKKRNIAECHLPLLWLALKGLISGSYVRLHMRTAKTQTCAVLQESFVFTQYKDLLE